MISYLRGIVVAKEERYIVLVLNDQIGYRVHVTNHVLEAVNFDQEVSLYILTYVREDALDLYGFSTMEELNFFEKLIGISGVGPKSALGVLSIAKLADIKKAIIHGDPKLLQKVTSIGKKTAERIIIELKEKITVTDKESSSGGSIAENVQLIEALESLGYKEGDIRQAVQQIPQDATNLSERIKEALQLLSTNRK